jgi:hypothetical protein
MQHDRMDRRLTQLRALVARLERLPASPRKEWMLQEARTRMVDVETGDEPRPMRNPQEATGEPPIEEPRRRAGSDRAVKRPRAPAAPQPPPPAAPPPAAPPPAPSPVAGPEPTADTILADDVLWLGEPPAEAGGDSNGIAPWRRGLRG